MAQRYVPTKGCDRHPLWRRLRVKHGVLSCLVVIICSTSADGATPIESNAGAFPEGAVVVDFNSDGKSDVVAANFYAGTLTLLAGDGTGRFVASKTISTGGNPIGIAAGDLDGDSAADLAVAVLQNDGSGTLAFYRGTAGTYTFMGSQPIGRASSVAVADLDSDGNADVLVSEYRDDRVELFFGLGSFQFESAVIVNGGSSPFAIAVADLNKDGIADLILSNYVIGSGSVTVLLGVTGRQFELPIAYQAGPAPAGLIVADFDKDRILDLAVSNTTPGELAILRGNGDGTFRPPLFSPTGGVGTFSLTAIDYNLDGVLDIAVSNSANGNVSLLSGLGRATFSPAQPLLTVAATWRVIAADVNGDRRADLLVISNNAETATLSTLLTSTTGRGRK